MKQSYPSLGCKASQINFIFINNIERSRILIFSIWLLVMFQQYFIGKKLEDETYSLNGRASRFTRTSSLLTPSKPSFHTQHRPHSFPAFCLSLKRVVKKVSPPRVYNSIEKCFLSGLVRLLIHHALRQRDQIRQAQTPHWIRLEHDQIWTNGLKFSTVGRDKYSPLFTITWKLLVVSTYTLYTVNIY